MRTITNKQKGKKSMKTNKEGSALAEKIWSQYEAGKSYHRRIGLYERVNENERFYRGDQWDASAKQSRLPMPVFNIIKRITDYLCGAICENSVSILYTDESLPLQEKSPMRTRLGEGIALLNRVAAYRFEKTGMDTLIRRAVQDAVISGDAVFYTYWDPTLETGQVYRGDFVTELVDNVNFFVGDVNSCDIQSQPYLILAGRAPVCALKEEARRAGCREDAIARIVSDDCDGQSGDYGKEESADRDMEKATYLIKFYRRPDGCISFQKTVHHAVIRTCDTTMRRYPVAYFSWDTVKNCYHGVSPITSLIPNQKYLNRAYAMVMKHMMDTAFSKVIYDKKLIPEWTNEVGQAIGVVSGGNVEGAVTTVGVGELQPEYLEVIRMTETQSRLLLGATDTAMGESIPQNNSALLAMREASLVPLEHVRLNLYQCMEDLACIWAEMMCEYYADGRTVLYCDKDGIQTAQFDFATLRSALLLAKVEVGAATRFGQSALVAMLDKLLEAGHITFRQYLERLPDGVFPDRRSLLQEVEEQEEGRV